jgi:UDP-N-acetylglucosamine--N-acetylmuramyl-(pentapeptide) pyrophosphoryl-undecaprenol N-acetylglucosamine transferase
MSRILIAGGGTAGHVVPALAVADVLSERGYEVHFCGGPRGMEGTLVPAAGYPFSVVRIRGFSRRVGMSTIRTLASLPVAAVDAWALLRRLKPACVVGVGAYASGPVVAEAAVRGVPAVAVEMDSHIGWTNTILSHLVDRVCLSFPMPDREGGKYRYTGRPVRPGLLAATRAEGLMRFDLDPSRPVVVIFGGSLGARSLNTATLEAFAVRETPFSVLHVAGKQDEDRVRGIVEAGPNGRYHVFGYLDDFPLALAAADVAVSRAGEHLRDRTARGVPSILVPYPHATGDHQMKNAQAVAAAGAATVVPESELTHARLALEVDRLLDPATMAAMGAAALRLAKPDAAALIADQIAELAGPPRSASS